MGQALRLQQNFLFPENRHFPENLPAIIVEARVQALKTFGSNLHAPQERKRLFQSYLFSGIHVIENGKPDRLDNVDAASLRPLLVSALKIYTMIHVAANLCHRQGRDDSWLVARVDANYKFFSHAFPEHDETIGSMCGLAKRALKLDESVPATISTIRTLGGCAKDFRVFKGKRTSPPLIPA